MNNQARNCKLECKYNIQGICHTYGECIAKDLFIVELETIKTEINKQSLGEWYVGKLDGKSENVTTIESINKIINKHISELKGE